MWWSSEEEGCGSKLDKSPSTRLMISRELGVAKRTGLDAAVEIGYK